MPDFAHEIFLLMVNLSQIKNGDEIIRIYVEAINAYTEKFKIQFVKFTPSDQANCFPITTLHNQFGYIVAEGNSESVSEDFPQLFFNSIQMLAVLLERLSVESRLEKENLKLEQLLKSKNRTLFESEEITRALTEFSSDYIMLLDLNGRIKYINHTVAELTKDQVIGKFATDYLHESAKLQAEECYRKVIETKSTQSFIAVYDPGDGRLRYYNTRVSPVMNNEGTVYELVSSSNEITERIRQSKRIAESETKFRTIFNTAADGILIGDSGGKIVDANPAFLKMTGFTLEDIAGKSIRFFFTPDTLAKKPLEFSELDAGKSVVNEREILKKDGTLLYIEMNSTRMNENNYISIIRDLSERRSVQAALMESEEKFRVLAETTTCAIFIYKGAKFVYANRATELLTGYAKKELVKMNFWDVVHPEFQELIKQRGEARQRGESVPRNYKFPIITKEGQERWIDFSAGKIKYAGEFAGLGTAIDITDWKKAESELWKHRQNLREKVVERTKELTAKNAMLEELNKQLDIWKEASFFGIARINSKGEILDSNKILIQMLGYTPEEFDKIKHQPDKITPSEYREIDKLAVNEMRSGKKMGPYSKELYRKDMARVPVVVGGAQLLSGKDEYILFIVEVSDIKKANEELYESERRLSTLLSNLQGMAYRCYNDPNRTMEYVSQGCEALTGYSPDSISRDGDISYNDIILEEDRERIWDEVQAAVSERQPFKLKYRIKRKNGDVRWVAENGVAVRDEYSDTVLALEGFIWDIHDEVLALKKNDEAKLDLQRLAQHLQSARDEERTHIARELHDQLGQDLTALKMNLTFLRNDSEQYISESWKENFFNEITSIQSTLDRMLAGVREFSNFLRPDALEMFGLFEALDNLIESHEKQFHVQCSLRLPKEEPPLSQEYTAGIYRIVQEALTNTAKHSQATEVTVKLTINNNILNIEIKDNGIGIVVNNFSAEKHFGLISMRERAALLKGEFNISGKKGEGTVISVNIPLEN